MGDLPKPPAMYQEFVDRYPQLAEAWKTTREAADDGPLDERTQRLIKLGIAIGSLKEGPVHSATRKALAAGVTREEIDQVVCLAAGNLGFPQTVAIYSWLRDVIDG